MTLSDLKVAESKDLDFLRSLLKHWHIDTQQGVVDAFVTYHNILMDTGLIKYSVHAGDLGTRTRAGLTYKSGRCAASSFDADQLGFQFKFFRPDLKPYPRQHLVTFTVKNWSGFIYLTPDTLSDVLHFSQESFRIISATRDLASIDLRSPVAQTPIATSVSSDSSQGLFAATPSPEGNRSPIRIATVGNRIQRDNAVSTHVKRLHDCRCQICGHRIQLPDGTFYAEAHHIMPLGEPHRGPDIPENVLCVCPNHHVELDYHSRKLDLSTIRKAQGHTLGTKYLSYHNNLCKAS